MSTSNSPDLSCQPLRPECQNAVCGGGNTTTVAAATSQSTPPTTVTTPPTTKPTTQSTMTQKATTNAPASSAAPVAGCQDQHPYCCFWADNTAGRPSECDQNAKWMKTVCQKSCGTCGCSGDVTACPTKVNVQGCPYTSGGGQGGQGGTRRIFIGGGQTQQNTGNAMAMNGGNGMATNGGNGMATNGGSSMATGGNTMGGMNSVGPANPTGGANPTAAGAPPGLQRINIG